MILFLGGLFLGTAVMLVLYLSVRRLVVKFEEERQLLEQEQCIVLDFMHHLHEGIAQGVPQGELFRRIVHGAVLGTSAMSACIYEFDPTADCLKSAAVEGLFPPLKTPLDAVPSNGSRVQWLSEVLKGEVFKLDENIIGSVATSQKSLVIKNALDDPRIIKHQDSALLIKSLIVSPICFGKTLLGVLAVVNPTDAEGFDEMDLSLIKSLSEQAALALYSKGLINLQAEKSKLDFDLSLAKNIQHLLLSRDAPDIKNLEIGIYFQAAKQVGGDLYELFRLSDHRLGLVVADVSGKGVPASLLMTICYAHMKHFAYQHESPQKVLTLLAEEMNNHLPQDMFITIIYAVIDTKKKLITVARGGHEYPLLFNQLGVTKVVSEGIVMNALNMPFFEGLVEDKTFSFEEGDVFILYTDGITEATNQNHEEFSVNRLSLLLQENHFLSAKALNDTIIKNVGNFTANKPLADDCTLITVKYT
ncbi:MAG: hypothetical protein A2007_01920 [Verrucomicrobia bacterium GWC2_42_7]|nr:MAG: hypothetical protein A2007_01920 [Verrucomicrobia bacterium GWC2_42_7]